MTLIKQLWTLRGDLQQGIKDKNEQVFAQVIEALKSPGFEFAVMNSKMATNYLDILDNDYEKILDRPSCIPRIIRNVQELQDYRMGNRLVSVNFGDEECPLHTLWVARAKFEKFKHEIKKRKGNFRENYDIFQECFSRINNLFNFAKQSLPFDDQQALMVIKESVQEVYDNYSNEWFKGLPPR